MRKREPWMFHGATVLADGERGKITKMETNTLDDIMYVYYIHVKLEGKKHSLPYHPNDIQELRINWKTVNTTLTRIVREAKEYESSTQHYGLGPAIYKAGALAELDRAAPLLKALEDARDNIQWMLDNLKADKPQDQHDRSMNTIENINRVIENYKNDNV